MSKLLKLTGLKSFTSSLAGLAITVQRNEVVRVSDADAEKLEKGHRRDLEGNRVAYWTEPSMSDKTVNHDFTGGEKDDEPEPETAAPARPASRQRRTS